jgi:Cys-tRNA(Pro)/Cys-tRNA(Cys) deacylase
MLDETQYLSPVAAYLSEHDIQFKEFTHPGPVRSLEQAAQERGQTPEQVIRSILFRLPEEQYLMVLASGPDQISWKTLRQYLGTSRLTMATDEDLEHVTGYLPGAVSPFGILRPIRVIVDQQILTMDEVSIGSGVRGTTIILTVPDLMKALGSVETVSLEKS